MVFVNKHDRVIYDFMEEGSLRLFSGSYRPRRDAPQWGSEASTSAGSRLC